MFPRAEAASEGREWGVQFCSRPPRHWPARIGHLLEAGFQCWTSGLWAGRLESRVSLDVPYMLSAPCEHSETTGSSSTSPSSSYMKVAGGQADHSLAETPQEGHHEIRGDVPASRAWP